MESGQELHRIFHDLRDIFRVLAKSETCELLLSSVLLHELDVSLEVHLVRLVCHGDDERIGVVILPNIPVELLLELFTEGGPQTILEAPLCLNRCWFREVS